MTFPKYLSIQTTSLCNASCIFCPSKDVNGLLPEKVMDMSLYKKIIDECSSYKNIRNIILYMNNEPLTDPFLIERIDYSKERLPWASVHILTNGLLLTDDISEKLLNSKLDWIGISFHGIRKDTIEKAMGINYDIAFQRINNFIDKAKARKDIKNYLMITFIKHKHLSLQEKEEVGKFWRKKGIKRISYFNGPISRAGNVKTLAKIYHSEKIVGCNSIWANEMMHITEDGRAVLCCMDWKREVILGDLNKESLSAVWNKKRKEVWEMIAGKKNMPENFLCRYCEEAVVEKKDNNEVLLVISPPWGTDTPPLGIACLSASLKSSGISTKVFDMNIELYNSVDEKYRYLWSMNYSFWWRDPKKYSYIISELNFFINSLIEKIVNCPQRIIGFSLPTNCSDLLLDDIVKKVKERFPEKIIILGGVSISIKEQRLSLPKQLKLLTDYYVAGEGEEVICSLASMIFSDNTAGINSLKGVMKTCDLGDDIKKAEVTDLSKLPVPDFDGFVLSKYRASKSLTIEFSRGCIGNCPFCDFKSVSLSFRMKNPEYITEQIRYYINRYGITHISVCDPAVNGDIDALERLCDLIYKKGIEISISAMAMVRKEMNSAILKKMKRAGFYRLEYGIESGSNKILQAMRKYFTIETAERVLKDTFIAGIQTWIFLIVGYPGETEYDFKATQAFLKNNVKYITKIKSINPLYIMAGSEIFYNYKDYGITLPANNSDREWYISKDNTHLSRKRRVLDLKHEAEKLKIPFTEEGESLEFTIDFSKKNVSSCRDDNTAGTNRCVDRVSDVLLVMCPPWGHRMPPLGLAYIVTFLKNKGFKAAIYDFNIDVYNNANDNMRELWKIESLSCWQDETMLANLLELLDEDIKNCVDRISNSSSKFIGFSVNEANIIFSIEIAKKVKQRSPDKIVIFGGPGCYREYYKDSNLPAGIYDYATDRLRVEPGVIDAFVRGEGELIFYDLLTAYKENTSKDMPGTIIFENKQYKNNGLATPMNDLSILQYPTFEEFELHKYSEKTIPLIFGRGCINKCNFCNDHIMSGKYRNRLPKDVVDEIRFHYKRGIREFFFCDLLINGNLRKLEELCDLIVESNINISWVAQAVIRKDMNYTLLYKLHKSGCISLIYGVESFSDNVLRSMNKTYTSKDIVKQLKDTKDARIKTLINIIVGFPGEKMSDFEISKSKFRKALVYIDQVSSVQTCHLTPGSDIDIYPNKYGITRMHKEGWFKWYVGPSNNYNIREKRLREFIDLIRGAKKTLLLTNLYKERLEEEKNNFSDYSIEKKHIRTLLIMCPPWGQDMPPLGLAYLYASLKAKDKDCAVWDINIEMYDVATQEEKKLWRMENFRLWNNRKLFEEEISNRFSPKINFYLNKFYNSSFNIVGFFICASNVAFAFKMAKDIKENSPGTIIIFGGPHCSWIDTNKINLGIDIEPGIIDIFVFGEGEDTLSEIIDAIEKKKSLKDIAGIMYYNGRNYMSTRKRPPIDDLDSIPLAQFSIFPLHKYTSNQMPILLSRGCMRRCNFCNDAFITKKYRFRSAISVFQEMRHRVEENGTTIFQFNDLIINGNLEELEKLCRLIIRSNLNITWFGQGAIRPDMSFNLLELMRKAGFISITYGVESFSDKVLELMNKPYTSEEAKKVLQLTKRAGIEVCINIIVGFPGENEDEFKKTLDSIQNARHYIDAITSLAPCLIIHGSALAKNLDKLKIIYRAPEGYFKWYIKEKNDYELRKSRVKRIMSALNELNIKSSNVISYDEDSQMANKEEIVLNNKECMNSHYDFIFVNLPPWAQDSPHIGLGYLCSYLRKNNYNIKVLDLNKDFFIKHSDFSMLWHVENKSFWSNEKTFKILLRIFEKDIDDAINEILQYDCKIFGFSVIDPKERLTIEFVKRIKEKSPNKKIVLGGPATSTQEQRKIFIDNINDYIDAFVVGEGEETLLEIVRKIVDSKNMGLTAGCFAKNETGWAYKKRAPVLPLDKIQFPTYEEFDMNLYGKSLLVEWSRGCFGKCAFCKNWRLSSNYRHRSADNIIKELIYHKKCNDVSNFTVTDNILNGNLCLLNEVCDKIIDEDLNIRWTGQIAPRRNMTLELFTKMKKAGCYKLQIGLESGSNKILKAMRKTFTAETSARGIRFAHKAGIETEIFVIIGFPGESDKDFKKTYNFIIRNTKYINAIKSINTLHLVAGTEVFEEGERKFKMKPLPKSNWHYLWETYEGNTYETRKKRAKTLLHLASVLNIKVIETNIAEGKESSIEKLNIGNANEGNILMIKQSINHLQRLPGKKKITKKRKNMFQWFLLLFLSLCIMLYIVYFSLYALITKKALLGGKSSI